MTELLTKDERAHAARCGWEIRHVFTHPGERWIVEIFPLDFPATSVKQATDAVTELARKRDAVAIRALQLIVLQSHQGATSK